MIDFFTSAIASCRSSRLAPETRTASPWIAGLDLQLAVLDQLDDLLGQLLLDADAHRHHLLDLVAGDLLDVAVLERADVDAALGRACR